MSKEIGKGLKLLVLEDEKDICQFTKEFLVKRGFSVSTAFAGKSGILLVKKEKPDIALLDIHLGKGKTSGLDVLEYIKENQPNCCCIMVTYDDKEENIKQAKDGGAFDYLTKPLSAQKVDKVIAKAVKKVRKGAK